MWPCLESFVIDLRVDIVPPPRLEACSRVIELGVDLAFLIEKPLLFRYFGHQHNPCSSKRELVSRCLMQMLFAKVLVAARESRALDETVCVT